MQKNVALQLYIYLHCFPVSSGADPVPNVEAVGNSPTPSLHVRQAKQKQTSAKPRKKIILVRKKKISADQHKENDQPQHQLIRELSVTTKHSQHLSPSASNALAIGSTASPETCDVNHGRHSDTTAGERRKERESGGCVKRIKLTRSSAGGGGSHRERSSRRFSASKAQTIAQPESVSNDAYHTHDDEAPELSENTSKEDARQGHGNAVMLGASSEERTERGDEDRVAVRKRPSIAEMKAEM